MSTNTLQSQNIQESVCRFCRNPGAGIQYSYATRPGKFTGYTTSYSILVHNQCFPLLAKVSSLASKATESLQRWHHISSKSNFEAAFDEVDHQISTSMKTFMDEKGSEALENLF